MHNSRRGHFEVVVWSKTDLNGRPFNFTEIRFDDWLFKLSVFFDGDVSGKFRTDRACLSVFTFQEVLKMFQHFQSKGFEAGRESIKKEFRDLIR